MDVYVDGTRALDDFQPGTNAGPVDLPAGSREVAISPADAPDGSGEPLLSATADLPAGGNVTLVAHLSESGAPTVTPFVDDVSPCPPGRPAWSCGTPPPPAVGVLAGRVRAHQPQPGGAGRSPRGPCPPRWPPPGPPTP
ncbi:DUF4397 domain-containing protein [Pseudonocardia abyssalis]|uniref:DUF4397 domain-containing protein n=1 Tax=Pseudonocardia abyssalis TaxID=2792008 RepID=UPI001C4A73E3|nr:DUF4397 domain-containing protein [Pseudonocardia abyssalis]MBW0119336.1 DUF4397 domain-containing protein [Pseudonocardia abyssalis]